MFRFRYLRREIDQDGTCIPSGVQDPRQKTSLHDDN